MVEFKLAIPYVGCDYLVPPFQANVKLLLLCILASAACAAPQVRQITDADSLLVLQDLRVQNAPILHEALRSGNPAIATAAALAAANLQDTSALGDLLPLIASDQATLQATAALALGQIAPHATVQQRQAIQIRVLGLIDKGRWSSRLIEECGKFGDSLFLESLIRRADRRSVSRELLISVARFALRGIVSASSETLLLDVCTASENVPWEAVYALQRAGDHGEVRSNFDKLTALQDNPSPLVRMNLATLAGKLRDFPPALAVLETLLTDADWRARVNAARGLVQWPEENATPVLRELPVVLRDSNSHVQFALLTALQEAKPIFACLAGNDTNPAVRWLDSMSTAPALPFPAFREPIFAIIARLRRSQSVPFLASRITPGTSDANAALRALAGTASDDALRLYLRDWTLIGSRAVNPLPPLQRERMNAILDGLEEWIRLRDSLSHVERTSVRGVCMDAIDSRDVALVAGGAGLLSSPKLQDRTLVPAIRRVLTRQVMPDDIESAQALVGLLRTLGDSTAPMPACPIVEPVPIDSVKELPDTVHVTFETSRGSVIAELYPRAAPFTVANLVSLARRGFFSTTATTRMVFHRVVPNFVVQGGDPRGDGWGGPGFALRTEISTMKFETGSIGMASAGRDTEGSQFFFTHSPQPHLDGRYTVFGKVVRGMDVLDRLQMGDTLKTVTVETH